MKRSELILRIKLLFFISSLVFAAIGCNGNNDHPFGDERISLRNVFPSTIIPGSTLIFEGEGFLPGETVTAEFDGNYGDTRILVEYPLTYLSTNQQKLIVPDRIFPGRDHGHFNGKIILGVRREGRNLKSALDVSIFFARKLVPHISTVEPSFLSFMEPVVITGAGFIFPGEGSCNVVLNGVFIPDNGEEIHINDMQMEAEIITRNRIEVPWKPSLFGLTTGSFQGDIRIVNIHSGPGGVEKSSSNSLEIQVLKPSISGISPPAARRGQAVNFIGRGFLPISPETGQNTLIRLEGVFNVNDGSLENWRDSNALEISGEWISSGKMRHVIRPPVEDGNRLTGFGHKPGVFNGKVHISIRHLHEIMEGETWEGTFEILPTMQVVYLKYLPTFSEALRKFGLRNVEMEIRNRILHVCRRDYSAYNMDFRAARPTDYVDYSVIELAGRDPNQLGLFGLDNTQGLDHGNLRLDDVIGGHNAETEEEGFFSYGGVFLESFLAFSPSLGVGFLPDEYRSSRFDDLFGLFIPELGGSPVAAGEYPGGNRDIMIEEAIRALGNMLGNTVVHEIGHSLGMVSIPGMIHHDGRTRGLIMNPGQARSFEERTQIDGKGPAVWHTIDVEYLESILPRDP